MPSASAKARAVKLHDQQRIGAKWSTTPSIAAIANMDMAITLRPSMRSRWRLDKGVAGDAADDSRAKQRNRR